mmetsp:Transcript_2978/g.5335  ORF Transcript_2978/g.5335 Transcript_2978/m.5335 type:complete len:511 (+) Transcript_2978:47-1579(+)
MDKRERERRRSLLRVRGTGLRGTGLGDRVKEVLDLGGAASELVVPEEIAGVLDEFDKGDEETPWVRSVDDETLEKDAGDLFLDDVLGGFGEHEEDDAAKVVGVVVGVAQLVGDGVEEEITAFRIKIAGKTLEEIKGSALGSVLGGGLVAGVGAVDGKVAGVEDKGVDEGDVVAGASGEGLGGREEETLQEIGDDLDAVVEEEVEVSVDGLEGGRDVGADVGGLLDLGQHVDLQVGREGVGQTHVAREGREDEVAHLDARDGDDVAERKVKVAQKVGKVVEEDEQHAEGSHVEQLDGLDELRVAEVGLEELEQLHEDEVVEGLAIRVLGPRQQLGHEETVRGQLEPSKRKGGHLERGECQQCLGDEEEHLPVVVGGLAVVQQLGEELDKETVVRTLVKVTGSLIVVEEDHRDDAKEGIAQLLDLVFVDFVLTESRQGSCRGGCDVALVDDEADHLGELFDGGIARGQFGVDSDTLKVLGDGEARGVRKESCRDVLAKERTELGLKVVHQLQ